MKEQAVWTVDLQYRLVQGNRSFQTNFAALTGREPAIGISLFDQVPDPLQRIWKPRYEKILKGGTLTVDETHSIGGISRSFAIHLSPLFEGRDIRGALTCVRDTTWEQTRLKDLDRFFSLSHDLLSIANFDGYFIRVSQSWCDLLGYEMGELLARPYTEFIHPEDVPATRKVADALAEGESILRFENRYRCKDGSYRSLAWTAVPVSAEKIIYTVARDVTDERYRKIIEESINGVFQSTLDGRFLSVNRAMARMYGFGDTRELLGSVRDTRSLYVQPEQRDQMLRMMHEFGRVENLQAEVYRKDGSTMWISEDIRLVKDASGNPLFLEGITRDITAQHAAEAHLALTARRLESLIVTIPSGVLVEDEQRKISLVNQQFCDLFQLPMTPEEMVGIDCAAAAEQSAALFRNSSEFASRIARIIEAREPVVAEPLERTDGKHLERDYVPLFVDETFRGHLWIYRDVTSRVQSEKALAASERLYETLAESMSEGILFVTNEDVITYANRAFCDMVGYSRDELMGRAAKNFLVFDEADARVIEEKNQLRRAGISDHYEIRLRKKSGQALWTQMGGAPMRDAEGTVIGSVGIVSDITARKEAEKQLRLSDSILRNVSNLVLVAAPTGEIVYVSPSVTPMLGYQPEEILGNGWWETIHSENTRRTERAAIEATASRGQLIREGPYEQTAVHRDGTFRHFVWQDALGPEGLVIGVAHDVTERKKAELALRESEQLYHDLVHYSAGLICTHDMDGRVLSINPASARLFEYTEPEMVGHSLEEFIAPSARTLFGEYLEIIRRQGYAEGYLKLKSKSGKSLILSYVNRVHNDPGGRSFVIGYAQDVTQQHLLEKEKERLIGELRENLAKVKTLSGLLPICASCKKVRDDSGYWHQIESYISKHSDAEFTHGLCRDCQVKLYPELFNK